MQGTCLYLSTQSPYPNSSSEIMQQAGRQLDSGSSRNAESSTQDGRLFKWVSDNAVGPYFRAFQEFQGIWPNTLARRPAKRQLGILHSDPP